MKLHFTKMQGAGNDYVYADRLDPKDAPLLAPKVSDRHFGVGSDGLVLVLPAQDTENHAQMRMFNADGSEAEMCGNAVRCVARFVRDRWGETANPMRIETKAGVKTIWMQEENGFLATVDMGAPQIGEDLTLSGKNFSRVFKQVSMGNPHAVTLVESVETAPVLTEGPVLEVDRAFPNRSNIEFAQILSRERIALRVWERGAGETLACGTGACATAVACALWGKTDRSVAVELPGGTLSIEWRESDGHVYMTGPAEFVFEGVGEFL
jgi:diaminopimelate epimerase